MVPCRAFISIPWRFATEQGGSFLRNWVAESAEYAYLKKMFDFNLISYKNYSPYSWQDRPDEIAWSLGFVSSYGSSQTREDFVEVIANYIVKTDAQWNNMLDKASKEWVYDEVQNTISPVTTETDGVNGKEVILKKLDICRQWLFGSWGISLDALRYEVQTRQANINMNALLVEIEK